MHIRREVHRTEGKRGGVSWSSWPKGREAAVGGRHKLCDGEKHGGTGGYSVREGGGRHKLLLTSPASLPRPPSLPPPRSTRRIPIG